MNADAPWAVTFQGDYTIKYRLANEVVCDFELFMVAGLDATGARLYGPQYVADLNAAPRVVYGHVKWDGCSNIMFDECAENCMLHFCGRDGMRDLAAAIDRCYTIARDAIGAERCIYE